MRKLRLVFISVCLAVSAQAATIFSNGFNGPPASGSGFTSVNSGTIGPWTVGLGGVDWISSYWVPEEGDGSVDTAGNAPGSLSTMLNTIAGQTYTLSFYLAGNPDGGNAVKRLEVQVGTVNQVFTFNTTGHTKTSMGWVLESVSFVASGNDTLTFTSLDTLVTGAPSPYGAALDGVSVSTTAIPEPATYAFALLGLIGVGLFRRRAHRAGSGPAAE